MGIFSVARMLCSYKGWYCILWECYAVWYGDMMEKSLLGKGGWKMFLKCKITVKMTSKIKFFGRTVSTGGWWRRKCMWSWRSLVQLHTKYFRTTCVWFWPFLKAPDGLDLENTLWINFSDLETLQMKFFLLFVGEVFCQVVIAPWIYIACHLRKMTKFGLNPVLWHP